MTITVHHLNNSRSQRILWLLEELGADYDVRLYLRDATTNLAPPELKGPHPLGKSPLIEDDGLRVAESGAIVDYLCQRHGGTHLLPMPGTESAVRHDEWMHFAEGSAMTPVLLQLYLGRLGEAGAALQPRIEEQLHAHFAFIDDALAATGHLVGDHLTAADVMISFPAEIAVMQGLGERYPHIAAFVAAIHARPAWQRALKRGGAPYFIFGG